MEWSRIKTILICVFIFVNLFLFSVYFKSMYTGKSVDRDVIANTVDILKQNNIDIDEDIIPVSYENVKICSVENRFANVKEMLEYVWENNDKDDTAFFNRENTKVSGNSFICKADSDGNENIGNREHYAEKKLQNTGLLSSGNYKIVEKDGYVYFYLRFEDKVFFDSYIRVSVSSSGIKEIYGVNWLGDHISEEGVAETVSPAEILINFSSSHNFTDNVSVECMTYGYYTGERTETVRVTASPVWEITVSDGNKYYYDMRNGDLLE